MTFQGAIEKEKKFDCTQFFCISGAPILFAITKMSLQNITTFYPLKFVSQIERKKHKIKFPRQNFKRFTFLVK